MLDKKTTYMKTSIITIVFIGLYFMSFSQDKVWQNRNYVGFSFIGLQSKINLIYNDTSKYLNMPDPTHTSLAAGVSFKNFSEKLGILNVGIAVDLSYLEKGGFLEFNLDIDSVKTDNVLFKYKPTYIELKPLMDLSLGKKKFHVNLFAGPHFSYIISQKLGIQDETLVKYKAKADNNFDFGLNFGGGFDLELGRSNIELRLLSSYGFTNIFNSEEVNVDLWYNQNRVLSAQLYYYYKL